MTSDRELEQKVDDLFAKLTPDLSEQILTELENTKEPAEKKRSWKNVLLRVGSLAAVFVLMAVGLTSYALFGRVDSTVTLDVNPSIELLVNRSDRVLRVTPLNEDGEKVIGTMRLKNVDIDVAVNALIGSMMKNGYLSEIANSILVTVDGTDEARSLDLSKRLSEEIEALLSVDFSGAVLSQTAANDDSLKALADEHAITLGKAQLIQTLTEQNPLYTFEELSKLSINELNVLLGKQNEAPDAIHQTGSASTSAYIGEEQALAIACEYAELAAASVELYKPIELDFEDGRMVYEIEFRYDSLKYEFEIDAVSGEIVSFEREQKTVKPSADATEPTITPARSNDDIGEARAKEIALSHAKVSQDAVRFTDFEKKRENGVTYYEIEFFDGTYEYEYKVNAATGAILKAEKERDEDDADDDDDDKPRTTSKPRATEPPQSKRIGASKAKEIALRHAGISKSSAKKLKCELDREDGKQVYEVEFTADGYEYEYTIDAETGKILEHEKERDD